MKKLVLFGLLLSMGSVCVAQTDSVKVTNVKTNPKIMGNNEIRLNLLYTVLGIPELTYERILGDESAVGLSTIVGFNTNGDDTNINYGFIPYYRVYFGRKKAAGFFIEANTALMGSREREYHYEVNANGYVNGSYTTSKRYINFGAGAALGGKFLTKNGFVGEAYFGLGRLFGKSPSEAYPRMGITIGKRF